MDRDFTRVASTPRVVTFPLTLENIADKPVTFKSKQELVRYCREHGKASGALL